MNKEENYKTIFSKEIVSGMIMASVAIHNEDFNLVDPENDMKKPVYKDIRIEICVAGRCKITTLDKIIKL